MLKLFIPMLLMVFSFSSFAAFNESNQGLDHFQISDLTEEEISTLRNEVIKQIDSVLDNSFAEYFSQPNQEGYAQSSTVFFGELDKKTKIKKLTELYHAYSFSVFSHQPQGNYMPLWLFKIEEVHQQYRIFINGFSHPSPLNGWIVDGISLNSNLTKDFLQIYALIDYLPKKLNLKDRLIPSEKECAVFDSGNQQPSYKFTKHTIIRDQIIDKLIHLSQSKVDSIIRDSCQLLNTYPDFQSSIIDAESIAIDPQMELAGENTHKLNAEVSIKESRLEKIRQTPEISEEMQLFLKDYAHTVFKYFSTPSPAPISIPTRIQNYIFSMLGYSPYAS